ASDDQPAGGDQRGRAERVDEPDREPDRSRRRPDELQPSAHRQLLADTVVTETIVTDTVVSRYRSPRNRAVTAPAIPAPTPMNPGAGPAVSAQTLRPHTRRNVELGLLIFAMALLTVYAGVVEGNTVGTLTRDFWVPVALLSVIFVVANFAVRFFAPYADPV